MCVSGGELHGILEPHLELSILAEAQLLAGRGDPLHWLEQLRPRPNQPPHPQPPLCYSDPPGSADAAGLRASVQLEFSPDCPRFYGMAEAAQVTVLVKKVPEITVKVRERGGGREGR